MFISPVNLAALQQTAKLHMMMHIDSIMLAAPVLHQTTWFLFWPDLLRWTRQKTHQHCRSYLLSSPSQRIWPEPEQSGFMHDRCADVANIYWAGLMQSDCAR